jgi:D-alanine-D-alanine ligase
MARDRAEGRLDLAFIMMHGEQGEDGQIQALLGAMGVPHTGSDVVASALCMDKRRTQTMLRLHGLPVPPFLTLEPGAWGQDPERLLDAVEEEVGYPCVLKPLRGGSSVGVQFPGSREQLSGAASDWFAEDGGALLCEKKIAGRELTCGVIEVPGSAGWQPMPLAATEIRPLKGEFFDYHCKYTPGATDEITPAALTAEQTEQVQALAVKTHQIMGCRGFSRTDFMLGDGGLWILEINTIPGMTATSLLPQGAAARGIDYGALLTLICESGLADLSK